MSGLDRHCHGPLVSDKMNIHSSFHSNHGPTLPLGDSNKWGDSSADVAEAVGHSEGKQLPIPGAPVLQLMFHTHLLLLGGEGTSL